MYRSSTKHPRTTAICLHRSNPASPRSARERAGNIHGLHACAHSSQRPSPPSSRPTCTARRELDPTPATPLRHELATSAEQARNPARDQPIPTPAYSLPVPSAALPAVSSPSTSKLRPTPRRFGRRSIANRLEHVERVNEDRRGIAHRIVEPLPVAHVRTMRRLTYTEAPVVPYRRPASRLISESRTSVRGGGCLSADQNGRFEQILQQSNRICCSIAIVFV